MIPYSDIPVSAAAAAPGLLKSEVVSLGNLSSFIHVFHGNGDNSNIFASIIQRGEESNINMVLFVFYLVIFSSRGFDPTGFMSINNL